MKAVTTKKSQSTRAVANGVLPNITYQKNAHLIQQKTDIRSILNSPFIQRKVVIGQANDHYEREADTVAERVITNQPAGPISQIGNIGSSHTAQRQSKESNDEEKEEEEAEPVQSKLIQRQSDDEEEEEPVQTKQIQRQSEESGAEEREEEEEPVQAKRIQRQSEESGDNEKEEEEEPVQTRLIQRQNDESGEEEREEQEEPVQSKLVQRQSEEEKEEEPVQAKQVQRQSEESGAEEKEEEEAEPVQTKLVQRQSEEEEEETVQTKVSPASHTRRSASRASAASHAIHNKGSGSPLQPAVRQRLESSMGVHLDDIRVHRDGNASQSTRALHAKAFTHKKDIWLAENQSPHDLRLMAHEVTHVRQQDNVIRRKVDPDLDKDEEEKTSTAGKAAAPESTPESGKSGETKSEPESKEPVAGGEAGETETKGEKKEAETPSDIHGKENFDEVVEKAGKLSRQQQGVAVSTRRSKKTADQAADNASKAVKMPPGEKEAHGQGNQVDAMGKVKKKDKDIYREDKKEFIKLVKKRIAELNMPKTAFQHMIFVATGGPQKFKQGVVENVNKKNKAIKSQLDAVTKAKPVPEKIADPEKLKKQSPAPKALNIDSAKVLPPPKAPHEVSMEKEQKAFHGQNEADGITREKLIKANDPRFTAAQEAVDEYDQNTAAVPKKYAEVESAELAKDKSDVESGEKTAAGRMRANRFGANKKIHGDQGAQMDKEYKKRDDVTTRLKKIYKTTYDNVQPKLDGLESKVDKFFDTEEKIITLKFNTFVSSEIDKFKDKRYSGFGKVKWLWDKTLGDFNELDAVKDIYDRGIKKYTDMLEDLIDKIAGIVVDTLNSCHKEIDKGVEAVKKEIKALKTTKNTAALETARDVLEQLKGLRGRVTEKKNELVNLLANKYQSSREKMHQALEKIKEENRSLREKAERFIDKVKQAYREFKKRLSKILARAKAAINDILDDPIQFLKNMLAAIKRGFDQFKTNIWKHLKRALYEWMFGSFSRSGVNIEIPKDFSPKSVLIFIMSVLGFTKEWILDRVAKVIGRQNVERLKKVYDFVKQLLARGLVGMYDYVKTRIGNLKDQIIEEVKSWVIVQIIKAAIIKLVSMFNPASAIVQAVLTIIDVVLFFANNIDLILRVLETIVDSVYKVVKGQIQGAADMIERALAMGLALAIRFLARFAKISGIVGKISSIIKRFKGRITRAVDKALKAIASKVKGLLGKGKAFVKKTAGKIAQWWKRRKTFKVEDKKYSVYTEGSESRARLFVSSSPGLPYSEFLKKYPSSTEKTQAIKLAKQLEKPKPRKEDRITNANKKVALFNKISTLMIKIAKTRGKLPPTAITFGSVRKDGGGTEMKASILSKDHPKGTGVQDKDTKIWTDLGSLRKGSGKESNPFIQGHLLNDNIGGPGRMWNLTPIRENANKRHLHDVEKHIKTWIGKGNVAYYHVQTDYPSAPRRTSEQVKLDKQSTLTNAERKKLKALREGLATRRLVNKLICTAWKLEYDNGSWKQAKAKQEIPGMKSKTVNVYNK